MAATDSYEAVIHQLGMLHKRLRREQGRYLEEYDISVIAYHILIIMRKNTQISQNDLAASLDVDKAMISRQIQAMEQKGFLRSTTDPDCRRKKLFVLPQKAQELIPVLQEGHCQGLEQIFSDLDDQQVQTLYEILEGLVRKI